MHIVETKQIENYLIEVVQDTDPENPRSWENLGTMVCFHNRYDLGDKHNYNSDDYDGWDEMEKDIIKRENVGAILPLYLYDHSGITMNTTGFGCKWDSGQVGFIFISKEKMLEEYGGKRVTKKLKERVTEHLKGEVETYDQYLRGDVYGYQISRVTTCNQGHEHKEDLDSCYGFFGMDSCLEDAESIVNYHIENEVVTDEEFSDMLHSVDRN
jgi:hypothetical protein